MQSTDKFENFAVPWGKKLICCTWV